MSKFKKYLDDIDNGNLKNIALMIKEKCQPFLKEIKSDVIYRGAKRKIKDYALVKTRIDRKPSETSIELHKLFDDELEKKFGWRPRSEGVFTSFWDESAMNYGQVYLFYPIGEYKYVWSPNISDLYGEILLSEFYISSTVYQKSLLFKWNKTPNVKEKYKTFKKYTDVMMDDWLKERNKWVEKLIKKYTDKNLRKSISEEMSFKCRGYFLINRKYEHDLINIIGE